MKRGVGRLIIMLILVIIMFFVLWLIVPGMFDPLIKILRGQSIYA